MVFSQKRIQVAKKLQKRNLQRACCSQHILSYLHALALFRYSIVSQTFQVTFAASTSIGIPALHPTNIGNSRIIISITLFVAYSTALNSPSITIHIQLVFLTVIVYHFVPYKQKNIVNSPLRLSIKISRFQWQLFRIQFKLVSWLIRRKHRKESRSFCLAGTLRHDNKDYERLGETVSNCSCYSQILAQHLLVIRQNPRFT